MRPTPTLFFLLCLLGCDNYGKDAKFQDQEDPREAMVVSARKEASDIGLKIMKDGGNAFDAMIATHAALAVAYPYAGNLAGGGFLVFRTAGGEIGSLDFREKAPKAAFRDMYLDEKSEVIEGLSTNGALAVGVPGSVAGMLAVHERYASKPLSELLEPSIELARNGVTVTEKQQKALAEYRKAIVDVNKNHVHLTEVWNRGDRIKYPALANTLERLARNGDEEFRTGESAQKMVSFLQFNGGIISLSDLQEYEVAWRKPLTFDYDDLRVISMPPPSSGGICLAQIMELIEPFDIHTMTYQSDSMIQLLVEAERRSYADRAEYLGDPDFVAVPTAELLDREYLNHRMSNFQFGVAGNSDSTLEGVLFPESDETTHYSIIDQFGNAVSVTTTINSAYGSKLYDPHLGFFYNNQMDDFSAKPGVPNLYGLVGKEANSIAPEKRMLSSMTPTVIEKNGELWMVLGTPGGSRIITTVLQTILNVHEFNMNMQDAVDASRFHHQWLPDEIMMEKARFPLEVMESLLNMGYRINQESAPIQGRVDAILVHSNGTLEAGADHRGDDHASSAKISVQ